LRKIKEKIVTAGMEKNMNDEEKKKLAAIKETNKEIFELTEKALKENPVFSYENEKTGEIDNFLFKEKLSLEIRNKNSSLKSKFYVFENQNSGDFAKSPANEILRQCHKPGIFKGVEAYCHKGVNSVMGVAHIKIDTSTGSGGGNLDIKSSQSNLTTTDIFKRDITQTLDFSNISEFHLPYVSKLIDKSTSNFSTLFSESRPLVVSFDTEYTHVSDDRYTLTAMYSFKLFQREFIVLQVLADSEQLKMQDFKHFTKLIMRILKNSFDLKKFPLRYSKPEYDKSNQIIGENVKKDYEGRRLHVSLITHFGRTDLSFFKILSGITYKRKNDLKLKFEDHNFSMLSICRAAGAGGVFSMKKHGNYTIPVDNSNGWNRYAMFNVTIRDTMNFTNANNLSLASLGASLGLPKMDMSKAEYECMHSTFKNSTYKFIKYSLADALITQRYFNQIIGENIMLPPTYNGLNAECFKAKQIELLFKHYNFGTREFDFNYDEFFRGIEKIQDGLDYNQDTNKFTPIQSYRILNNDPWFASFSFQMCESYYGGNNQCIAGYWIDKKTIDIDLKSAYPTAEACIYDIDYQKPGFTHETERAIESFTNLLMMNPFLPCVVCLKSFKFPDTVKYPCITQKVDGNIVYTREKTGHEYIYINGIEYWAALKMGCKMHVISILQANILLDDDKNMVKTLGLVNSHLISKRKELAEKYGKKSKQALDYKLAANGSYGKMAQGMNDSNSYNALVDRMESVGGGCITNPYYASYITAIARVILNLTSQEITDLGYSTYSNTTDGLITDLPEELLPSLKIYGLKRILQENRALFFNEKPDSDIFEVKHRQDTFLNVATRHNIALNEGGVLAHGGIKTEYEKDSMQDRFEMIKAFLQCSVNGYDYKDSTSVSMRQIVMKGKKFNKEDLIKNHAMRYDFKRKPCSISDENIEFQGNVYTVARFDTVPYLNIEEFLKYRAAAKTYKLVRTASDFNDLILKTENNKREKGKRVYVKKNVNETKVTSLLRLYFQNLIDIPAFDNKTQSQIAEILNDLNYCKRKITINDIKNAKRKNRTSALRIEDVEDLINLINESTIKTALDVQAIECDKSV
jgi:hypothetical protein